MGHRPSYKVMYIFVFSVYVQLPRYVILSVAMPVFAAKKENRSLPIHDPLSLSLTMKNKLDDGVHQTYNCPPRCVKRI